MQETDTLNKGDSAASLHRLVLVLFAAMSAAFVLQSVPLRSANDRSRWSTVWALVERGTYQIDEIDALPGWKTIDKVRHRRSESDEWHTYSTKPPLTPTLVAGVYYVVHHTTGYSLFRHPRETTRLILLVVNVLPMLLALAMFSRLIRRHTENRIAGAIVLCTACFGTLLTPFLTTFNNHTIAATGVLLTICFSARILIEGSRSGTHFALVGFFAMWTCCNELPAALFGLVFFWMLFRVDSARTLKYFVPAALVPLAGFLVANYLATGGWKPFYMYYGTDRYVYSVDGVPSYWSEPRGLDANTESPLTYFLHCVLGHHGILSLTPIFLLSVLSVCRPRSWKHPTRPFLFPGVLLTVTVLGFYLYRTQNYNYGGTSSGLRWAFWLIPFWLIALIPIVERAWANRAGRWAVLSLLCVSIATSAASVSNPWSHPWLYNQMQRLGWIDYSEPPPQLEHELRSWLVNLPDVAVGESIKVRYENNESPVSFRTVEFKQTLDGPRLVFDSESEGVNKLTIGCVPESINAGLQSHEYLAPEPSVGRDKVVRLLTGLPMAKPFAPRRTRYIKTELPEEAFRCIHASATVFEGQRNRSHRCDIWLTPEVPFGAARIQTTVADLRTREILSRQTWTISQIEREPAAPLGQ